MKEDGESCKPNRSEREGRFPQVELKRNRLEKGSSGRAVRCHRMVILGRSNYLGLNLVIIV